MERKFKTCSRNSMDSKPAWSRDRWGEERLALAAHSKWYNYLWTTSPLMLKKWSVLTSSLGIAWSELSLKLERSFRMYRAGTGLLWRRGECPTNTWDILRRLEAMSPATLELSKHTKSNVPHLFRALRITWTADSYLIRSSSKQDLKCPSIPWNILQK